ncbi:MAG: YihY family inner membrane protein [Rhodospirillaceae bacterium]|nr:YihY family inner membrane protein [Rhodospirillaceae bacterium]
MDGASKTRLERWRHSRIGQIGREVIAYVGYALVRFHRDRGTQAASALTYTTLLALVPLLAIAFSIFAAFPVFEGVRVQMENTVFDNLVPEIGDVVREQLGVFLANTTQLGVVGIVALGLSAILLLATIESTLNRIWRVKRPRPFLVRLLVFWAVLTLGPLLMSAAMTVTASTFAIAHDLASQAGLDGVSVAVGGGWLAGTGHKTIAVILQTLAFTAVYLLVPNRRVALRDAVVGGLIAGILFEVLKGGFGWYMKAFPTYQTIYGAMSAVPIFLIWVYFSWAVVLLGAVFAASFPDWWAARGSSGERTTGSAARFLSALAILGAVSREMNAGRESTVESLAKGGDDALVQDLTAAGWLTRSEGGGLVLARVLDTSPAHSLYCDLGLSMSDAGEPMGAQGETLSALADGERSVLVRPVADLLGPD